MIALVSSAALVAVAAAGWLATRLRRAPMVVVVRTDGTTRELPADDPRISDKI
jgi:hypothetical protein